MKIDEFIIEHEDGKPEMYGEYVDICIRVGRRIGEETS